MKQKSYIPWLYLAPFLFFFCLFFLIPFVLGIYYSFTDYNMVDTANWVGLENYKLLFDPSSTYYDHYWIAVKNTIFFMIVSVPFLILIPFGIACLINSIKKGMIFVSIFYIPCIFSITSAMLIWFSILGNKGLINYTLDTLFGVTVPWLTEVGPAWIAIIASTVWWTIGLNLLIFLAGIKRIPGELYESAGLDGAGSFRKTISVTIPALRFQLLFTSVMTMIASANIYGQPIMLTKGGPGEATNTATMYIRATAFGSAIQAGGLGCAMAIVFGAIVIAIAVLLMWLVNKIGRED